MIEPGKLNGYLVAIKEELRKAEGKHPDFCDKMIDPLLDMTWNEIERGIKLRNDRGLFIADNILGEEVAEAFNAYQQGDKKHALQELAQCGAVILRIMAKVDEEIQKEKRKCRQSKNTRHTRSSSKARLESGVTPTTHSWSRGTRSLGKFSKPRSLLK